MIDLTKDQLEINRELVRLLTTQISQSGPIRFSEYMHRCLYEPGLGYYVNGLDKIGAAGDFITAPELSADFAQCIANQSAQVLALCGGDILEFGGGTGRLAVDVMLALDAAGVLPDHYYLLDVSIDLQHSQQLLVACELPVRLNERVRWVSNFVTGFKGVVLANELFDAFPVEQFKVVNGEAHVRSVNCTQAGFSFTDLDDVNVASHVGTIEKHIKYKLADGYVSEFCPVLQPWWQSLSDSLDCGAVLVCDYGCELAAYYTPVRSGGSLRCFFRHGVHDDTLVNQGIQDITADVDFTALAEAATGYGFALEGYTTLVQFMLSMGVLDHHHKVVSKLEDLDRFKATGKLKQLLLPEEMGERFMVAGFSKNIGPALQGFSSGDMSRLL